VGQKLSQVKSNQWPGSECLWRGNSSRDSGGDARAETSQEVLRKSRRVIDITDQTNVKNSADAV
jgi:hypothetical protein